MGGVAASAIPLEAEVEVADGVFAAACAVAAFKEASRAGGRVSAMYQEAMYWIWPWRPMG